MTEHRIIQGDVLAGLRTLPDCCVQCTVTSPPYYNLRNYGVEGQIGLEDTPELFIQKMVEVFHEVRRVTRNDGVMWLNFGDSYAGSGCGSNDHRENGASISKNDQKYTGQNPGLAEGFKAKDLMGIPWRVAFALQADGWYFRSAMPWIKRSCMPESTTDRPTSAIEYIFLMAKSAKYFYDGEAIRVPSSESYHGNQPNESGTRNYRNSDPFFESWQGLYSESENPLAFIINPQSRPEAHFATFPDLLAETCIKAGTSERGCCPKCGAPYHRIVEASGGAIGKSWHPHDNDEVEGQSLSSEQLGIARNGSYKREFKGWKAGCKCEAGEPVPCLVLEPFLGSGTTMRVARDLGRSSVGCELNPEYIKIARKLLNCDSQLDTGVVSYKFEVVNPA